MSEVFDTSRDCVVVRGREKFRKFRWIFKCLTAFFAIFPIAFRAKLFEFFRFTGGKHGIVLRYVLLKTLCRECGENVTIFQGCYLYALNRLSLGSNVSIHPMCYIDATGDISIGSDVSIAHGVTIMSSEHQYQRMDIPIKDQNYDYRPTEIRDNTWIGAKATVLGGAVVEKGCIIAAGAVVKGKLVENGIYAGVPAVLKKMRIPEK